MHGTCGSREGRGVSAGPEQQTSRLYSIIRITPESVLYCESLLCCSDTWTYQIDTFSGAFRSNLNNHDTTTIKLVFFEN